MLSAAFTPQPDEVSTALEYFGASDGLPLELAVGSEYTSSIEVTPPLQEGLEGLVTVSVVTPNAGDPSLSEDIPLCSQIIPLEGTSVVECPLSAPYTVDFSVKATISNSSFILEGETFTHSKEYPHIAG